MMKQFKLALGIVMGDMLSGIKRYRKIKITIIKF